MAVSGLRRGMAREQFLKNAGLTVLRLENRQVFENPDGVLDLIRQQFGLR
jgi:very-short-patch-repair endonuclease